MKEKKIEFVKLLKTSSVSLTGEYCALNCKHCGRHYLKSMANINEIEDMAKNGDTSFLISGGLMPNGKIPFSGFKDKLKYLKKEYNLRYNFHTGFVDEEDLSVLKELSDVVSYDLVGDKKTYYEVYGKGNFEKMWDSFFLLLENGIKVKPHVTLGLRNGDISHEIEAIKSLKEVSDKIDEIIFLIFIPTKGTEYQSYKPPKINEVVLFLENARKNFPETKLTLGCMQPKGNYRKNIQEQLLGVVDKIVQPVFPTIKEAEKKGFEISYSYECCAL
jgi:hypothetical protein